MSAAARGGSRGRSRNRSFVTRFVTSGSISFRRCWNSRRRNVGQPAWRFELVLEPKIPEVDECADMVCFISVFTHLMQEESFLYLREAQRVLKPGGRILASYLDINAPEHWKIFEDERELGRGATIQTDGYFSFPGFSQGLGRKARSGDSSRRSARSPASDFAFCASDDFPPVRQNNSWPRAVRFLKSRACIG